VRQDGSDKYLVHPAGLRQHPAQSSTQARCQRAFSADARYRVTDTARRGLPGTSTML